MSFGKLTAVRYLFGAVRRIFYSSVMYGFLCRSVKVQCGPVSVRGVWFGNAFCDIRYLLDSCVGRLKFNVVR